MVKKRTRKKVEVEDLPQDLLNEIEHMSTLGMKQTHVADYLGFSSSAWDAFCKNNPKVLDRYRYGGSKGIREVLQTLKQLCDRGNIKAIELFLKNIAKLTDFVEARDAQPERPYTPVSINVTDPVEAAKIYQQIMQGS